MNNQERPKILHGHNFPTNEQAKQALEGMLKVSAKSKKKKKGAPPKKRKKNICCKPPKKIRTVNRRKRKKKFVYQDPVKCEMKAFKKAGRTVITESSMTITDSISAGTNATNLGNKHHFRHFILPSKPPLAKNQACDTQYLMDSIKRCAKLAYDKMPEAYCKLGNMPDCKSCCTHSRGPRRERCCDPKVHGPCTKDSCPRYTKKFTLPKTSNRPPDPSGADGDDYRKKCGPKKQQPVKALCKTCHDGTQPPEPWSGDLPKREPGQPCPAKTCPDRRLREQQERQSKRQKLPRRRVPANKCCEKKIPEPPLTKCCKDRRSGRVNPMVGYPDEGIVNLGTYCCCAKKVVPIEPKTDTTRPCERNHRCPVPEDTPTPSSLSVTSSSAVCSNEIAAATVAGNARLKVRDCCLCREVKICDRGSSLDWESSDCRYHEYSPSVSSDCDHIPPPPPSPPRKCKHPRDPNKPVCKNKDCSKYQDVRDECEFPKDDKRCPHQKGPPPNKCRYDKYHKSQRPPQVLEFEAKQRLLKMQAKRAGPKGSRGFEQIDPEGRFFRKRRQSIPYESRGASEVHGRINVNKSAPNLGADTPGARSTVPSVSMGYRYRANDEADRTQYSDTRDIEDINRRFEDINRQVQELDRELPKDNRDILKVSWGAQKDPSRMTADQSRRNTGTAPIPSKRCRPSKRKAKKDGKYKCLATKIEYSPPQSEPPECPNKPKRPKKCCRRAVAVNCKKRRPPTPPRQKVNKDKDNRFYCLW